ncbi:MAG TPA: hypothetical protein VMI54_01010 [Polyangiaceae bacterium]|nr:hypothetical protein [Polyangiaceae bacterium]
MSLALTLVVLALAAMTFRVVRDGEAALAESDRAFNRGDLATAVLYARRAAIAYAPGAPHTRAALARLRAVAVGSEGTGDVLTARLAWGAIRAAAVETRFVVEPYASERDEADRALARLLTEPQASDANARTEELAKARELLARTPGPTPGASALLLAGLALAGFGLGVVALRGVTREGRVLARPLVLGLALFAVGVACWTWAAYRA